MVDKIGATAQHRAMMFSTPAFWYEEESPTRLFSVALAPFGWLYGYGARKRFDMHFPVPLSRPIVCVGNLTAGGAGKTPVALAVADLLMDLGYNPHFLTRGYGGRERGPLQVAPGRDIAADVGDEALLLVEKAPTWVSANRPLGAQAAIDTGANVIILDDGFQNPALYKDLGLVVVDGGVGFGNGRIFPAGPLREELRFGLSRAHAAVIVGEDRRDVASLIKRHADIPILQAALKPHVGNPNVNGQPIFAFAGIGRPQKFKETLIKAGAHVEGFGIFPDHFPYIKEDLKELVSAAEKKGLPIFTTTKDYVRLPTALRQKVQVFRVDLTWQDQDQMARLLKATMQGR